MPGDRRWQERRSVDQLRRTLTKYEELAEAHREAAELAQQVGSEAAYTHQMERTSWYEQEADKLRYQIAEQDGATRTSGTEFQPLKDVVTKPGG